MARGIWIVTIIDKGRKNRWHDFVALADDAEQAVRIVKEDHPEAFENAKTIETAAAGRTAHVTVHRSKPET